MSKFQKLGKDLCREIGEDLWELFKNSPGDLTKNLEEVKAALDQETDLRKRVLLGSVLSVTELQIYGVSSAYWVSNAMPIIQIGHKRAAALMATNPGKGSLEDLKFPWSSFLIELPEKMLYLLDENNEKGWLKYVLVSRFDNVVRDGKPPTTVVSYNVFGSTKHMLYMSGTSYENLARSEQFTQANIIEGLFDIEQTPHDHKIHGLIGRLILGICLSLEDKEELKQVGGKSPKRKKKGRKAKHKAKDEKPWITYRFASPVTLDVRSAIQDWLSGERRNSVNVRTLVIGHWKNQPCGPGKTLRKRIWVEPYWRGPDGSPIIVRPHKL